jgi:hypothetical protein
LAAAEDAEEEDEEDEEEEDEDEEDPQRFLQSLMHSSFGIAPSRIRKRAT